MSSQTIGPLRGVCATALAELCAISSLHRLIAPACLARAETPLVPHRTGAPYLRPLRPVLVPWPGVEIAERLVLHLIHLGEELDPHLVGIAVIDRDVVADDVAPGPPYQTDVVPGEPLGGALDLRPVLDLEGDVMELRH